MTSSSLGSTLQAGTTNLWAHGARCIGRWSRLRAVPWQSPGGERVLVVAPHPDDEIGCAGTLLLHTRAGDEVHLAHATDGRRARTRGVPPAAMADRRRLEAQAAAARLAVAGAHWLGLHEGAWEESTLVPVLRELLGRIAPQVLYAPSCVDFHPEHIRVAAAVAQALTDGGGRGVTVRVYEVQVPLTPILVNLVAPLGAVATELAEVVRCYPTQAQSIERCLRMKRYAAALYGERQSVEGFWQLDAPAYARVVRGFDGGPGGPFRGVRQRPFTDPLAYLRGLEARRALRRRAAAP